MLNTNQLPKSLILIFFISLFLISCGSKKDVVYFQDVGSYETIVNETPFI